MFSLDRFYNILHNNLIANFLNGKSIYFHPFGTYQKIDILRSKNIIYKPHATVSERSFFHCYFGDQEPLYKETIPILHSHRITPDSVIGPARINIFATSEQSSLVNNYCRDNNFYNWYYFFHGFAALDWYKNFRYLQPNSFDQFDKVFICYNHLISKYRSYRLHLVANLIEQGLMHHGKTSLFLQDDLGTWQDTIQDPNTPLDTRARVKIYQVLRHIKQPFIIDTCQPSGELSAVTNFNDLVGSLFHVVTETVYFHNKLHLTEKIFKPIVAKRPFILVAAPGNLKYLKSYGFKTFDQWIDESYDSEPDHYIRIEKITAELKRLCSLSQNDLKQMHNEMRSVLEYNFDHFYTNFKYQIVDELVDNFEHILLRINNGREPGNHSLYHQRFDLPPGHLEGVKKRLKQ